ncbi:uncharacterized protein LOC142574037 isoform X2 [Dermacentor variabilis]|uniref:uncharacterized protein LOC142574037 isoform X2 n=1 Tax=Dermacentor variabilis TaxID=34621 RepID=UPI003F5BB16A
MPNIKTLCAIIFAASVVIVYQPDLSSAACDTSKLCNHNKTDECGPGCQCALIIDGSSTNIIQYRCSDTSLRTK